MPITTFPIQTTGHSSLTGSDLHDSKLPTTTKGDLLGHTGAAQARLPIGTNGQVLTVDTSTLTSLKWATPSGGGGGGSLIDWSIELAKANATFFSDYGAVGDGSTTNNTALTDAITATLASSTNVWRGYHVLYVDEAGSYKIDGFTITGIEDLLIIGDGPQTIFLQGSNYWGIFQDCAHIAFYGLDWDANGISIFGGLRMLSVDGLWFANNHMYDSSTVGLNGNNNSDRFALASTTSENTANHNFNWLVENNHFEDLQPSFGPIHNMIYQDNTITRGASTAGTGFWSNANGWVVERVTIRRNKFIDTRQCALAINKDVAGIINTVTKNMLIHDNEMHFHNFAGRAMLIGTASTVSEQTTDIFQDIWIVGNRIYYHPSCPLMDQESAVILIQAPSSTASFGFEGFRVQGNLIDGGWRAFGGIDFKRSRDSYVESNQIYRMRYFGMGITGYETGASNYSIRNNVIECLNLGIALNHHHGDLIVQDNKYLGNPATILSQSNIDGTGNDIDTPTSGNLGGQIIQSIGVGWNPAELADGASEDLTGLTVLGAAVGDKVTLGLTTITAVGWNLRGVVTGANTVAARLTNNTGGTVDLAAGTLSITVEKAMPAII